MLKARNEIKVCWDYLNVPFSEWLSNEQYLAIPGDKRGVPIHFFRILAYHHDCNLWRDTKGTYFDFNYKA